MEDERGKVLALSLDAELDGARSALLGAGFSVVHVASAEDALAEAAAELPAAVMLDLDDPAGAGYLVCRLLRERHGELLPVVLVSGVKTEPPDRVVGLLLGADDYLVKPFDGSELVARIRRLVTRANAASVAAAAGGPTSALDTFDLTRREQQVMELLLRGLTQADIARELVISSNTVATHIQRILLKLGVHNRAQAVAKVARAGWSVDGQPERPTAEDSGGARRSSPSSGGRVGDALGGTGSQAP